MKVFAPSNERLFVSATVDPPNSLLIGVSGTRFGPDEEVDGCYLSIPEARALRGLLADALAYLESSAQDQPTD